MKLIIHLFLFSLIVSPTSAHFCHLPFSHFFSRNCDNNADLKSQCERKVGFLSDAASFIATKKAVLLPALGLGLYSGITASALIEKANFLATSSLLGQVCDKFDDGEEHTIDELDYIEIDGLKINDLMQDYERIKSDLTQQDQNLEAKVADYFTSEQFQAQLKAMVESGVKAELAKIEAKNSATFASTSCSCSPNMAKTPEFPENSQFTKLSVKSDGEKSLESQPKIILKSSQTYPRMIRLPKRPRSRQSPLARQHHLASLRSNMENRPIFNSFEQFKELKNGRFSRSVPRKSRKIFSKPSKFPRKKPSPRLLKGKPLSILNIKGVKLLVENGQVAPEPEFLPHHWNDNVMK